MFTSCYRFPRSLTRRSKCILLNVLFRSPLVLSVFAWSVEMNEGSLCLLSAMPLCKGSLARFIEVDGIRETYKPYVKLVSNKNSSLASVNTTTIRWLRQPAGS